MKKTLNKEQIEHIALLARLSFSANEIVKLQKQLTSILNYVEDLNKIPTSTVQPLAQTTNLNNVFREDATQDAQTLGQVEVLQNAPQKEKGYIKVKKVLPIS